MSKELEQEHNVNNLGWAALQPLLMNRPYLPFTSSSLKPIALNFIINDIVINGRKKILELGSGLSTILIARLIQQNKLDAIIYSVDHDQAWINILKGLLEAENMAQSVKFIHAPLDEPQKWDDIECHWYDMKILDESLEEGLDLVLVDGPPAYREDIEFTRIFAFPYLEKKLNKESFLVILDDVTRKGELTALKHWATLLNLKHRMYPGEIGVIYKGSHYNSLPI